MLTAVRFRFSAGTSWRIKEVPEEERKEGLDVVRVGF